MRRFSGSTVAVNVVTPRAEATWARCASSTVASPRPCISSATANATSARSGPLELEDGVRDDALLGAGGDDQAVALGPVAGGGALGGPVEVHAEREEAQPARLLGQAVEERAQRRRVRGHDRPHVRGRAVAQRDVDVGGGRAHTIASSSGSPPKRTGSSAGRPVSASARRDRRARLVVVQPARVERDRGHARRAHPARRALVGRDQLAAAAGSASPGSRRSRPRPRGGRARARPAAAVQQPERDAGVRRVPERALALDEQQRRARGALLDEPRGRAGDEVGDHVVDGDAPAGDRDPGLAGGHERRVQPARARGGVELERDGHLADRAVGADGVHDAHVGAVGAGHAQAGRRGAQVAQPHAGVAAAAASSGSSASTVCRPASTSMPGADRLEQRRAPLGGQRAAERRHADHEHVRAERHGLGDGGHDRDRPARVRHDVVRRPAGLARVDDRDDLARAVAQDAVRGLGVRVREARRR